MNIKNFPDEKHEPKTLRKTACLFVGVWFECGGSRSAARVLRARHSSLDYVPIRCSEKVPRCAASLLTSCAPVVLENLSCRMLWTKTEIKTLQLKNAIEMGDSVFYDVDT